MERRGKVEIATHEDTQTADFLAGDKVVCVDTNWVNGTRYVTPHPPMKGMTYCVKSTSAWKERLVLQLISIYHPAGFYAFHFRRVHR